MLSEAFSEIQSKIYMMEKLKEMTSGIRYCISGYGYISPLFG
jgi:hypothetical protein